MGACATTAPEIGCHGDAVAHSVGLGDLPPYRAPESRLGTLANPAPTAKAPQARGPLSLLEAAGRGVVFCVPFFLEFQFTVATDRILLAVAGLALVIYYSAWARFFLRGRAESLLYQSLLGIPVPLALAPILYFLAFAVLTRSIGFALATGIFGVVHVYLSRKKVGPV